MNRNYIFRDVNQALPALAETIMHDGHEIGSRAGRTKEMTMVGVTLEQPCNRYITVHNRKASLAAQIAETMWVLAGRDDVEFLSHYLPRAADFSDDGKTWRGAYGKRLRAWPRNDGSDDVIDQIAWVVEHLTADRASRRATLSIFDPVRDQVSGKDIPCNDWIDFKSRLGKLDMHVALRSNDLVWGWSGINQFEWSTLLEIVAKLLGVVPGNLHFSISSLHIYDHHFSRVEKFEEPKGINFTKKNPAFDPEFRTVEYLDKLINVWFSAEKLIREGSPGASKFVARFPEPMMRSWLRVLQWWWSGDFGFLDEYMGTELRFAALNGIQPKEKANLKTDERPKAMSSFSEYVAGLHAKKHAGYGDSWKKRGELLSILPNIARKVDRLQQPGDDAETTADTAIDLLVYLLKYRWWLSDQSRMGGPFATTPEERADEVTRVAMFLKHLDWYNGWTASAPYETWLAHRFDEMASRIERIGESPADTLEHLIRDANALARREFWKAGNAKRSWKGYGDE